MLISRLRLFWFITDSSVATVCQGIIAKRKEQRGKSMEQGAESKEPDVRSQTSKRREHGAGSKEPEVGDQSEKSDVRSQKSEIGGRRAEMRDQRSVRA
jgi:hypothetical protein